MALKALLENPKIIHRCLLEAQLAALFNLRSLTAPQCHASALSTDSRVRGAAVTLVEVMAPV